MNEYKMEKYKKLLEIKRVEEERNKEIEQEIKDDRTIDPHKVVMLVNAPIEENIPGDFRCQINFSSSSAREAATYIDVLEHGYMQVLPDNNDELDREQCSTQKSFCKKQIPVTKVLLKPISGRRHQLRVHLDYLGHPIVGDFTYGNPMEIGKRLPSMISSSPDTYSSNSKSSPILNVSSSVSSYLETIPRMMLHAFKLKLPFPSKAGTPGKTVIAQTEDPFVFQDGIFNPNIII